MGVATAIGGARTERTAPLAAAGRKERALLPNVVRRGRPRPRP